MPRPASLGRARRFVSAGGVVFRRTPDGPEFALVSENGRWGFPKGTSERDETPELTALREISEETGLPLTRLRIVRQLRLVQWAFRWEGTLAFKTVHYYLVSLNGEAAFNPQLSEVEEAQWFTPAGARRAISFTGSRETLDAAIAGVEAGQVAS